MGYYQVSGAGHGSTLNRILTRFLHYKRLSIRLQLTHVHPVWVEEVHPSGALSDRGPTALQVSWQPSSYESALLGAFASSCALEWAAG